MKQARTRHLTDKELMEYFDSKISAYRERMIKEAAYDDGLRDGERKSKAEIARAMLADGLDTALIAMITHLSAEEIDALK